MPFDLLLEEVENLNGVSTRIQRLADEHAVLTTELLAIAESVRNTAVLLAVIVATRAPRPPALDA
jgi:hypothetical protein